MNTPIIRPQMVGSDNFNIVRDLVGNHVFTINGSGIKMSPRQTLDLAIRLLKSLGHNVDMLEKRAESAPGPKLIV